MNMIAQIGDLRWSRVFLYGLIAAGVYWAGLYDNGEALLRNKEMAVQQLTTAQKQLEDTKNAMRDAHRFEQEVIVLQEKFAKITEFMPRDLKIADITNLIYDQAAIAGVKISKMDPDGKDQTVAFYDMLRVKLVFEGNFTQIVTFLSNLSKVPRLLTFDDAELDIGNSTSENPIIRFQGTLVGYRYSRPDGQQAGSSASANSSARVGR